MTDASSAEYVSAPIVAKAGSWYRNARFIMVGAILVFAAYFAYDGWIGWPKQNEKSRQAIAETQKLQQEVDAISSSTAEADRARLGELQKKIADLKQDTIYPHSDTDIMWQKILAIGLPFVAAGYAAFFLNRSKGEIRFENEIITAPGHPPIPLTAIQSVDASLWTKKGIAYVKYDIAGKSGTLRLDDFVYEQKPIDAIYEIVAKRLGVWVEPTPPSSTN